MATKSIETEATEVRAVAKYVRVSPSKARLVEYLEMDAQEPPASGSSSGSTGGELITVQRAALKAVYDVLGNLLQGG